MNKNNIHLSMDCLNEMNTEVEANKAAIAKLKAPAKEKRKRGPNKVTRVAGSNEPQE